MRVYGNYMCSYCRTSFPSLPLVAEVHEETGRKIYESAVPDTDCPKCKGTDVIEKAYQCEDCDTWIPESETVTDRMGNRYCSECRTECIHCGKVVKTDNAYYNEREKAYVCLECRQVFFDKVDLYSEKYKPYMAVR